MQSSRKLLWTLLSLVLVCACLAGRALDPQPGSGSSEDRTHSEVDLKTGAIQDNIKQLDVAVPNKPRYDITDVQKVLLSYDPATKQQHFTGLLKAEAKCSPGYRASACSCSTGMNPQQPTDAAAGKGNTARVLDHALVATSGAVKDACACRASYAATVAAPKAPTTAANDKQRGPLDTHEARTQIVYEVDAEDVADSMPRTERYYDEDDGGHSDNEFEWEQTSRGKYSEDKDDGWEDGWENDEHDGFFDSRRNGGHSDTFSDLIFGHSGSTHRPHHGSSLDDVLGDLGLHKADPKPTKHWLSKGNDKEGTDRPDAQQPVRGPEGSQEPKNLKKTSPGSDSTKSGPEKDQQGPDSRTSGPEKDQQGQDTPATPGMKNMQKLLRKSSEGQRSSPVVPKPGNDASQAPQQQASSNSSMPGPTSHSKPGNRGQSPSNSPKGDAGSAPKMDQNKEQHSADEKHAQDGYDWWDGGEPEKYENDGFNDDSDDDDDGGMYEDDKYRYKDDYTDGPTEYVPQKEPEVVYYYPGKKHGGSRHPKDSPYYTKGMKKRKRHTRAASAAVAAAGLKRGRGRGLLGEGVDAMMSQQVESSQWPEIQKIQLSAAVTCIKSPSRPPALVGSP